MRDLACTAPGTLQTCFFENSVVELDVYNFEVGSAFYAACSVGMTSRNWVVSQGSARRSRRAILNPGSKVDSSVASTKKTRKFQSLVFAPVVETAQGFAIAWKADKINYVSNCGRFVSALCNT